MQRDGIFKCCAAKHINWSVPRTHGTPWTEWNDQWLGLQCSPALCAGLQSEGCAALCELGLKSKTATGDLWATGSSHLCLTLQFDEKWWVILTPRKCLHDVSAKQPASDELLETVIKLIRAVLCRRIKVSLCIWVIRLIGAGLRDSQGTDQDLYQNFRPQTPHEVAKRPWREMTWSDLYLVGLESINIMLILID